MELPIALSLTCTCILKKKTYKFYTYLQCYCASGDCIHLPRYQAAIMFNNGINHQEDIAVWLVIDCLILVKHLPIEQRLRICTQG